MRRGLACFLALALLLCMAPIAAYAAETNETVSSGGTAAAMQPQTDAATITQGPVAVEDVAVIPAAPAAAPTIAEIAPAQTERILPAAALQSSAIYENDIDAVQFGMIVRADLPEGGAVYYDDVQSAVLDASKWTTAGGKLTLLRSYTHVDTGASGASPWLAYDKNAAYTQTGEDGITIHGFWFDLRGNTLTYKGAHPMIGRTAACSINIKNGTMIYQNTGRSGSVIGMCVTGITSTSPYSGGKLISRFTVKDAELYSLANAMGATTSANRNAVFTSSLWTNEIHLYNSKAIAVDANGVRIVKSGATIEGAALTRYQQDGAVSEIHLHGGSVLGSVGSFASVLYTKTTTGTPPHDGTAEGIEHRLVISSDGPGNVFLGTKLRAYDTGGLFTPIFVNPEGMEFAATCAVAMPDAAAIAPVTTLDASPSYSGAAGYPGRCYAPHTHAPELVNAVAATYAVPGLAAHWFCEGCGKLFADEGCTEETTLAQLAIPAVGFPIADAVYHEPVAPTYAAAGSIGYWSVGDTLYSDTVAAEPTVITEAQTVVTRLVEVGDRTDAELVELGAVVKVEPVSGAARAYDNIPAAYSYAKGRTDGAAVRLLRDFLWEDPTVGYAAGQIEADKLPNASSFENNEVSEMPVNGFWFDLGGHTLTARLGKSIYYSGAGSWVNLRNGRIIYQNTGRPGARNFGAITFGWSESNPVQSGVVQEACVNLYGVEIYTLDALNDAQDPSVVASSLWNTTVNVRDCTLIAATSESAIEYHKSSATVSGSDLTALQSVGANFTVNVEGASTVGSLNASCAAVEMNLFSGGTTEGIAHRATITASNGVTFLGSAILTTRSGIAGLYERTVPATFASSPLTLAFPDVAEAAEYTAWQHAHVLQHIPAQAAAVGQAGNLEYWYCTVCGRYWEADGVTETTLAALTLAPIPLIEVGSVESSTGAETRTVEVELRLFDNPGIAGGTTKLRYDARLTLTGIEQGSALASLDYTRPGELQESVDENGKYILLSWDGLVADHTNGVLLTLTFAVPTAEEGSFAIALETEDGDFYDGDLNDVAVATAAGGITVTCEHVWELWQTLVPETCIASGTGIYRCTVCGKQVQGEIAALNHAWDAGTVTLAATCTQTGVRTYTCSRCGDTTDETIPALGHDPVHHAAQAATCLGVGWEAYDTCTRCSYTTYVEIPALGHSERPVVTPATCTTGGYTTYTCTRCHNVRVDDPVAALGHNLVHHEAQAATHTQIGWEAYDTCTRCSYTTYAEIPKIPYETGDLNRDDRVDSKDVTLLRRYLAGGYGVTFTEFDADFNGDWVVNGKDVTLLRKAIVGGYGVVLQLPDADAPRPNETPRIRLD